MDHKSLILIQRREHKEMVFTPLNNDSMHFMKTDYIDVFITRTNSISSEYKK